jgi:hypothetical protein
MMPSLYISLPLFALVASVIAAPTGYDAFTDVTARNLHRRLVPPVEKEVGNPVQVNGKSWNGRAVPAIEVELASPISVKGSPRAVPPVAVELKNPTVITHN